MAVSSKWNKLRLLMWKHFLLQFRHKVQTTFEIFLPVLFMAIPFFLRAYMPDIPDSTAAETIYKPFRIDTLDDLRLVNPNGTANSVQTWKLVYRPSNTFFDAILDDVSKSLALKGYIGVQSAKEMENVLFNQQLVAGIEFHHPSNISEMPKHLSYSLRFPNNLRAGGGTWQTNQLYFPLSEIPRAEEDNEGASPHYYREGFVPIQNAIARAFVKLKSANRLPPTVHLQRFPIPSRTNTFQEVFRSVAKYVVFLILLAFASICVNTVRAIVMEKEKQLSETMKIMGLSSSLQWASWFLRTMTSLCISISLMVIMLSLRIYTHSNWVILWLLFFIYGISITAISFVVSAFFSKSSYAYYAANFLWMVSIIPYFYVTYEDLTVAKQLLLCLSPNAAMLYAMEHITHLELIGDGMHWSNIWHSNLYGDDLVFGVIVSVMVLTSIALFLITLYVERVVPGAYGVALPWYFPFTKVFWLGESQREDILLTRRDEDREWNESRNFEEVPGNLHLPVGIRMRNLRKEFSGGKVAVNDLSIKMFENQITVLLGQNGAGKSTAISMLTGMLQPTSGTAMINGYDIRTETVNARGSLGLCAQNSILFDELTVREHILFYSKLKGLDSKSAEGEVTKYTGLLNLEPGKRASALSGGMKRKLSLINALCGGSKVVLCDEPSSGMDPTARRELWKVLESEKESRTILLTTHYMDEADVLGDRIAIMAEGRLKCCGSSFFLKRRFGAGYHLICVKEDGCDSREVTNLLRKYFPNINNATDIGAELSYHLPDDDTSFFERMFADLENRMESLQLSSFGVSLTTLEDVFHKVNIGAVVNGVQENGLNGTFVPSESPNANTVLLRGFTLILNQWIALFKKKYYYWKRNWIIYAILNVLVVASMVYSAVTYGSSGMDDSVASLPITLTRYAKSVTILDNKDVNKTDAFTLSIMTAYKNEFNSGHSNNAKLDITTADDMQTYFLNLAKSNLAKANRQNLAGVTFNSSTNNTIIAWFNGQPYHTAPLAINLVHNAIVMAMIGSDHSIEVYNHPIKITAEKTTDLRNTFGGNIASWLGTLCALISAFYVMSYIQERTSKSKLLQLLSGVNVCVFWAASFLWDLLTFTITILLVIVSVAPFQIHNWSSPGELGLIFVILITFGFAMLPMTYLFSYLFKSQSHGLQYMILINFLTGSSASLLLTILSLFTTKAVIWDRIFLAFPHYAFIKSFENLDKFYSKKDDCLKTCAATPGCILESCSPDIFSWEEPGIGRNLTYMFVMGIVYFALLSLNELHIVQKMVFSIYNSLKLKFVKVRPAAEEGEIDADVLEEKKRVDELVSLTENTSSNLILHNLTRYYGTFAAVNRLSLVMEPFECFGLLGVNGAGKTTAFKMLTGDKYISDGDAWVCGVSVRNQLSAVRKLIAYCPQFDALLGDLTGRETLEIFGLLRGIRSNDIATISHAMATKFDFVQYFDKKVSEYSGGNKRKLSTALAFLGHPSVVYLDEPTAGMDPGAQRRVWDIVNEERSSGKIIVLTSHSMDECEALCSRVAIMVSGEAKCLGSMQHLKNKFSQGYEVTVKVKQAAEQEDDNTDEKVKRVMDYITKNFPGSTLKETYQELLTFNVPPSNETKLSSIFGIIESAKGTLIEDHTIKQTSLEQVFIRMAKSQSGPNK